jgi:hypothetical protein
MIHPTHINDRMTREAENRAGGDSRGGCATRRNMNRERDSEGGKAIAMAREGQLFAESEMRKPRIYQQSHE